MLKTIYHEGTKSTKRSLSPNAGRRINSIHNIGFKMVSFEGMVKVIENRFVLFVASWWTVF
jgi:hypothetical protein